jgi:hypothetical protein
MKDGETRKSLREKTFDAEDEWLSDDLDDDSSHSDHADGSKVTLPHPEVESGNSVCIGALGVFNKDMTELVGERPQGTTLPDPEAMEIIGNESLVVVTPPAVEETCKIADGAVGLSEATSPVWKFKCVREQKLDKQDRIDKIGLLGVFNEDSAKLANSYGKMAADGNAYPSTLSPDSGMVYGKPGWNSPPELEDDEEERAL